jgi:hypothetical protein
VNGREVDAGGSREHPRTNLFSRSYHPIPVEVMLLLSGNKHGRVSLLPMIPIGRLPDQMLISNITGCARRQ